MSELSISVIVPAYNAAQYLALSLPPLMMMKKTGLVSEVIVVDDCSTDGRTREVIEQSDAAYLSTPENGGPGFARNLAAKAAMGDLLWFVDADVVVHADSLHQIRPHFADPLVWAIFGSYDASPPAQSFASQYKNLVHRHYHQRGRADASTFWSGCGVVRKERFLAQGGFDTSKFRKPSIEDIELGYRLRDAGGRIVLDPDFVCTHLKDWTLQEVVLTDILKRALPWSRLLASRRGQSDDLNISQMERIRAGVAGLWMLSIAVMSLGIFWPSTLVAVTFMSLMVGALNWPLLTYFQNLRGPGFAVKAILFHQVYYVYSALTFVYARLRPRAPVQS